MTIPVDASNNYTFIAPDAANFDMAVHEAGFLRRTINVNVSAGNVVGATLNLEPGDVVADNVVDLSDYTALVVAFNALIGQPLYNAAADFNADGVIDLTDYTALVTNFNKLGDN